VLKNHWYALEFAEDVTDTPHKAEIMGQHLVLYRDSRGEVVAQSDICIHRGGPLSGGKIKGDCIECPYHGWQYDTSGACVSIPANREGLPIPKKARIDTYPAVERYGMIFVFLGDLPEDERPPVPDLSLEGMSPVAAGEHPGMKSVRGEFHWEANFERVMENAVDIAHAPFVHAGSFGNPDSPEVEDFEVIEHRDGEWLVELCATVNLTAPTPSGVWAVLARGKERPPVKTRTGIFPANVSMLEVNPSIGQIKIFTMVVPIDEQHSISKWRMFRSFFTAPWAITLLRADKDSWKRTMKIFYEDQPTVEGQRPDLVPFDISAELHVKSDALQLAYRRWRQEGIDKGWHVDRHLVTGPDELRTYRVIPSPARRNNPELANAWVLKEVEAAEAHRERAETVSVSAAEETNS